MEKAKHDEKTIKSAAMNAAEELADQAPGLDAQDAVRITNRTLDWLETSARSRPLVALGSALATGFLVALLMR